MVYLKINTHVVRHVFQHQRETSVHGVCTQPLTTVADENENTHKIDMHFPQPITPKATLHIQDRYTQKYIAAHFVRQLI